MNENAISMVVLVIVILSFFNALFWKFRFQSQLDRAGILKNKYIGMKQGVYWRNALNGKYNHKDIKLKYTAKFEILSIIAWISISILYVVWGVSH